ncbi:hypothetical protein H8959_003335 [Pygathrix nigripes]
MLEKVCLILETSATESGVLLFHTSKMDISPKKKSWAEAGSAGMSLLILVSIFLSAAFVMFLDIADLKCSVSFAFTYDCHVEKFFSCEKSLYVFIMRGIIILKSLFLLHDVD